MSNNRINWRECKRAFKSLFSFHGFKIIDVEYSENSLNVTLDATKSPRCPHCGKFCHRYDETYVRSVRDLDISILFCYITYPVRQIRCDCGYRGNQLIEFVHPYSRFTKRFENYVAQLSSKMTIRATSDVFGIDWKTVKRIDITHILDTIPPLESIRPINIGIDEVAYQKGHKYLTVVRDLDLQGVIWVGIGRSTATIDEFFAELGPKKSMKIETCCMDMWDPYINSVTNHTNAKIIFDKFHLVKIVNGSLDKIRKRVFYQSEPGKKRYFKRK